MKLSEHGKHSITQFGIKNGRHRFSSPPNSHIPKKRNFDVLSVNCTLDIDQLMR